MFGRIFSLLLLRMHFRPNYRLLDIIFYSSHPHSLTSLTPRFLVHSRVASRPWPTLWDNEGYGIEDKRRAVVLLICCFLHQPSLWLCPPPSFCPLVLRSKQEEEEGSAFLTRITACKWLFSSRCPSFSSSFLPSSCWHPLDLARMGEQVEKQVDTTK